jgi:hypothetical protein
MGNSIFVRNRSVPIFIGILALVALAVTLLPVARLWQRRPVGQLHQGPGHDAVPLPHRLAMDLVWGYCGILSLGHFAFFGLGGYMIGMWLMYARTEDIVIRANLGRAPPTDRGGGQRGHRHADLSVVVRRTGRGSGPSPTACSSAFCWWCWCPACWRWSSAGWPSAAA